MKDRDVVAVEFDTTAARAKLLALNEALVSTRRARVERSAFAEWGKYMLGKIPGTFNRGGRGEVRWARLAPSTKIHRRLTTGHVKPLLVSGALMRSVKTKQVMVGGQVVQKVYSGHRLAKIHQYGATLKPRMIFPRQERYDRAGAGRYRDTVTGKFSAYSAARKDIGATALRFHVGMKQVVFSKYVYFPGAKIPARPFVFITKADARHGAKLIRKAVLNAIQGKIGRKSIVKKGAD